MKLHLIFASLLAAVMFSCLDNIHGRSQQKEGQAQKEQPFKYWTWITADSNRDDASYVSEFKKYKKNGLDAVLINTNANPVLLGRLAPFAKQV